MDTVSEGKEEMGRKMGMNRGKGNRKNDVNKWEMDAVTCKRGEMGTRETYILIERGKRKRVRSVKRKTGREGKRGEEMFCYR